MPDDFVLPVVITIEQPDGTWVATSDAAPGLSATAETHEMATEMLEQMARTKLPSGTIAGTGGIA